ncbi:MAG: family 78 glycoside hydrolase catalytic domain [Pontiellaceae bacterium]|nr:family 78 glycoside hydrolase catalytic domain [Pontiellaceae bacterium]MBN2784450.1 family 78 glycoside hydrolase catalytic domain [Pontiellaceae bacterium]
MKANTKNPFLRFRTTLDKVSIDGRTHGSSLANPCQSGAAMKINPMLLLAFVWFNLAVVGVPAALVPVDLRCGMRVDPLGIGDTVPRLSWKLESDGLARGEVQSAYQIQVGSIPGTSDLWDSGKVGSDQTVDVLYGGASLLRGEKCYWRVRVYDGEGTVSAWSTNALWSMGLLSSNDWSAEWIGYDEAYNLTPQEEADNALFNTSGLQWVSASGQSSQGGVYQSVLRKEIVLPESAISNAVLALYADNRCNVYVNGQQMDKSALRWEETARINVTPWLHSGANVLVLETTSDDAQRPAAAIGRLVVQFDSGAVSDIPVDTGWKAASWPSGDWAAVAYDDSAWGYASGGGTPWGTPSLNDTARVPVPYLRKNFSVSQAVSRATVYVTALGAYELHLNGQKVGNDVLAPGWTDFNKRVYYQTYDVTEMVQNGANTLSALLGDGWYASNLAFRGQRLNYGGKSRLLAQLEVELDDGTTQTIVSDSSWKASYGAIRFSDLLLGSEYDARLELPGWDTVAFDDSGWDSVTTGLDAASLRYFDVTALVESQVMDNQLNLPVDNDTMGGDDPAFGVEKVLQITYQVGSGATQTVSFAENSTATLDGGGSTLTIVQALYGDPSSVESPDGPLVMAAVTEPSRVMETLPAVGLAEPAPGRYTFDLGQNMVGWVRLQISGNVGDRITVRHGEMLNPEGTVYTANLRGANATDFYTFGTNGTITYEPRFTFHGFRYVEITGLTEPPTLESVTGIVVHSDMQRTGSFSCSSPLVNQLYSNIIWGQKGNYLEVPTDCPQRDERLGWSGDTEFFVPTAAYNFDVQSFFRRHMVTFCEDSQNSDGSYAHVAPDLGAGSRAAAWQDAAWICSYFMYQDYGDTNILADHYASFQSFGDFLAGYAVNYVISSLPGDFGDWLDLGGGATGKTIDTAFYAYYAQAMSEIAAVLGKDADAAYYATLRSNIAAAFGGFFDSDGSFAESGNSQTAYSLAFTLNLVPDHLRNLAAQRFADTVTGFGNHLATGFIGTPRLLPALHLAGRDDLAYALLLQETYPSWLYQVTLGATTMWERWDGWTPNGGFQTIGMNSFNHYAFGAVGEYLYGNVGGISPASPGYKSIRIQPVAGDGLDWASTSYESVRGSISTVWTNDGGIFSMDTVIPPNTTAMVYVPTTNAPAITEGGVAAMSAPGVNYVGVSDGYAVFNVGSGRYQWSSPYEVAVPPSVIITTTNETGTAVPFSPSWSVVTDGSLIANRQPTSTSGDFNMESQLGTRSVASLTDGGSLVIDVGSGTTSPNYVTCGNNAGTSVTYTLTGSSNGYDISDIVVYGGWGDNGRDQQAYTVYYSTVSAPSEFISLATVNINPEIAGELPSATRVSISHTDGILAGNVGLLRFDFSSPVSENGYCGYAELTAFGSASAPPSSAPVLVTNTQPSLANMIVGDEITFSAAFESTLPTALQWQHIYGGTTNDIYGATHSTLMLADLQEEDSGSYRLVSYNDAGATASTPAPLTVNNRPAPVDNIITLAANQAGLGGNTFYPGWTLATAGSLIEGMPPASVAGDFSLELSGQRDVNSLTTTHDLGLTQIIGNPSASFPITTSGNYVTCGGSAGRELVYTLPGSSTGYDVTNITVYGGWADNGRDQQAYTVYYSTMKDPSDFILLTSVNYNPGIIGGIQSATRVQLIPSTGILADEVAALKFDFTTPASENGYCGYTGITVQGTESIIQPPSLGNMLMMGNTGLVFAAGNLYVGHGYAFQSTTNLVDAVWTTETNFTAMQPDAAFTNIVTGDLQKFYRLEGE